MDKAHIWPTFDAYHGRQLRKQFDLYKENGNAFALAVDDVVRFKLWKHEDNDGLTPDLEVDSVGATTNGSVITVDTLGTDDTTAAQVTVKLAQDDLKDLPAGYYRGELAYVDDSQTGDPIEVIARGDVHVIGSATGDVGLT